MAEENPFLETLRGRIKQRGAQAIETGQEALKRRFAAQGMLNSGAYLKSAQEAEQQGQQA